MINDPAIVKFVNERLRPRAEQIRNLFAAMADDKKKFAELTVPDDDKEILDDNRKKDGFADLSGAQILLFSAICEKLTASVGDLTDLPIITRFCERPLVGNQE